ncbi:hypothetical protein ACROYT_G043940 [Oculina patagonica]
MFNNELLSDMKFVVRQDGSEKYLGKNLDASNVFHVLPDARKYEEKDLADRCWEVIDKQAEEAVKSDGFVSIERSVLEELVERDSLNVKDVKLFKAVDCWATKECEKQGLAAEVSVKRRILGERIVKGIRFPVMEQKEFADVVLDCDILTKKELCYMMKYFNSVLNLSVGVSKARRAGIQHRVSRFRSGKKTIGWNYGVNFGGHCDSISLSVNKSIKLHAVRLFGSENNEYSVNLNVTDLNGEVLAYKRGTFLSTLFKSEGVVYHGFDIVLEFPVVLQPDIKYCIQTSTIGPPSWCGKDGLSRVEHSAVTFLFTDNDPRGGRTTTSRGQFCEFEFTVD